MLIIVYYILDKRNFEFDKRHRNVDLVNLIFFSKNIIKEFLLFLNKVLIIKKVGLQYHFTYWLS
jgi:hypothetical protein